MNAGLQKRATYSMEVMTTKLFSEIEKEVIARFGKQGKVQLQQGIEHFGYKDAEDIAAKAVMEGDLHTLYEYIPKGHTLKNKYDDLTPFELFAKLFAQLAKAVVDTYGDEGEQAIREGVWVFGEKRGYGIALRARANGQENTVEHYLPNYDMERSELFSIDQEYLSNGFRQTYTVCPLGQQWADDGMKTYGHLYCSVIDKAIAHGYNDQFEVEQDQWLPTDGYCHFLYQMKDTE